MGEKTGISWCDHTFNPWIGCEKVSAGCANCYAERQNRFYGWTDEWGNRKRTGEANWKKPLAWAKNAYIQGVTRRVFCGSLCDVLDDKVPHQWQIDLWHFMRECETRYPGALEWLLLTKRIENAFQLLPATWTEDPPAFIRLGVTAENQEMADKRVPELLRVWSGKNFISVEPMIGNVEIPMLMHEIDWIICGCESGDGAHKMDTDWARNLRARCVFFDVPFFLKQMVIDGALTKEPELDGRQWLEFPR